MQMQSSRILAIIFCFLFEEWVEQIDCIFLTAFIII